MGAFGLDYSFIYAYWSKDKQLETILLSKSSIEINLTNNNLWLLTLSNQANHNNTKPQLQVNLFKLQDKLKLPDKFQPLDSFRLQECLHNKFKSIPPTSSDEHEHSFDI